VKDSIALRSELRRLRKAYKNSARDFADEVGISHSTISKIENLKRNPRYNPDVVVVAKFIAPFNLTLADFFGRFDARQVNTDLKSVTQGSIKLPPSAHDDGGARSPVSSAPDLRDFVDRLVDYLTNESDRLETRTKTPRPRTRPSKHDRRDRTPR